MNAKRTLLVIDSGNACPSISFSFGFGSNRSIWLGAPSGKKKTQIFAFGAKCGAFGASGSVEWSGDESEASNPSFWNSDARARAPRPDALEVKNCRRARSIFMLSAVSSQQSVAQTNNNWPLTTDN